jgi:hypothetical protein
MTKIKCISLVEIYLFFTNVISEYAIKQILSHDHEHNSDPKSMLV